MTTVQDFSIPQRSDGAMDQLWGKITAALARGVVGFYRQSSDAQRRRNVGSQQVQEEQMVYLAPFGVKEQDVRVILAYGESGKSGVVRLRFRQLVEEVRAGQVGMIVLARHDRLGRDSAASEELFRLMREMGVLMMVDGRFYDPSDDHDALILSIYALFAEIENRARSRWSAASRFAKARALCARIPLPTGLVWANPEDAEYRAKLEAALMGHWVADMGAHRVKSKIDDTEYYVLPYPDAEVARAVTLAIRWAIETGSVRGLLRRIERGYEGWPRKGLFPLRTGGRFWTRDTTVKWEPVTKTRLYEFLQSPALAGTYRYQATSLRPKQPRVTRRHVRRRW